jgi:ubiquinone biosynthesis protein COQ9
MLPLCILQAMARDPKNYYQETWKQIRNKIKKFKNIPEQYSKYLESQKKQSSVESN